MPRTSKSAFTLIEILVSLAIVAVLSTVVVVTLNPAELVKQARDSNRISDLNTINTALGTFSADVVGGSVGVSSTVYVSLPSNNSDCSDLGLPTLTGGWVYKCTTSENLAKIDGTGWIPANLQRISFGNPLEKLPLDPKNSTSTGLYYTFVTTGSWWELTAILESEKYGPRMVVDGGASPNAFEQGTMLTLTPTEALDRGVPPDPEAPVAPTIASISPTSTTAGDPGFTLTVVGANFTSSSIINWGASAKTTSFVSSTQLTASILAADIAATGTIAVTVSDPIGGSSGSSNFAINERTQFIAGSWTTDSSGGAAQADGASITEVNGKFYIIRGYGTGFQEYNGTTKVWANLANVPIHVDDGGAIVKYDNNTLYVFSGNSGSNFYKYVISENAWYTMASTPAVVSGGGALSYPGTGDYIYAFRGGGTSGFWRYSISNNSWGESGRTHADGASLVEVSGKFYVVVGYGAYFQKYDPATNTWTNLANLPASVDDGAAIVKYDNDTLFALQGYNGSSNGFYKYVISENTWYPMANTPAIVNTGGSLAYPGTGDYIYALRGNSTGFWRYSISNNSWGESGGSQADGASIAEVGGVLYIIRGYGVGFQKYSPATNSWTSLANLPASADDGAAIVKYDNDTLFALQGYNGSSNGFYKYVISENTWYTMAVTPGIVNAGGSLAYPGTGDYIYATQGNSTAFWRYSIAGNVWDTTRAVVPATVGEGGGLTMFSSNILYATRGNAYRTFWEYNIANNVWTAKASVAANMTHGGAITSDGTSVYVTQGNANVFWKYDPGSNIWSTIDSLPTTIGASTATKGGLAYSPSLGKIFAISGSSDGTSCSIMEYDPVANAWPKPCYAPATVNEGGSLVALTSNLLYALRGGAYTGFYQYNIATGDWTAKASALANVSGGGSLATDGTDIYSPQGNSTVFWKYTVATNSWSSLASLPTTLGSASIAKGGIAYSPSLGKIFAISGSSDGTSCSIMEYDPVANAWPKPCYAPSTIGGGGALAAFNSGTLYAIKGAAYPNLWTYNISAGTWTAKTGAPGNITTGGSLTSDGTNVYATQGNATAFWRYNVGTNNWSTLSVAPATIGAAGVAKGGILYSATFNAIYAISGNSGAIYKNSQ